MTSRFTWLAALGAAALTLACLPAQAALPACPAVSYGPVSQAPATLTAEGPFFKDNSGRVVLLRGVNATGDAKVPPFKGITSSAMLDPLPGWGINTLRLLFTWEAYEPTRCQYNESYLAYYEQVVKWAAERGLYVIVDFHQDAYARHVLGGCGEGFPKWTVPSYLPTYNPSNGGGCAGWAGFALIDPNNHRAWSAFHNNTNGVLTRYAEMTQSVADRLAKYPNVIGYDLMNEPWGTHTQLSAMYAKVGGAIRSRHPGSILFFSPHAMVSLSFPEDLTVRPAFDNQAYSPHYYEGSASRASNKTVAERDVALRRLTNKATSRNAPLFMGEFGARPTAQGAELYLEALYSWMDAHFVSGTQWSYTPNWTAAKKDGWNGEDFSIATQGVLRKAVFSPRPYPQKTAGTPGVFKRTGNGLSFSWQHDPSLGSTELFLPADYLQGKTLTTSPADLRCSVTGQQLRCEGDTPGEATLTISSPSDAS
jgi:endoglycosylceramidase